MKQTFKSYSAKVLAVVLAMAVLASCAVFSASAALLNSVIESYTFNTDVAYASYSGSNANVYTMEFNPKTTNLMPMGYIKNAGSSSTLASNVSDAQSNGYTVHGAINGEFFSMGSGNAGTLTGRLIANGRILSDHETNNEYSFVIDKDGDFSFVRSQLAYHFYVEGKEVGNAVVARINKRYNGDWGYDPYCYFDSACGNKTDTVSSYKGVEVVFNKLNGSELVAEGILEGEVVSVNTNTYGTSFGENQFVLYAYSKSAYYNYLANLTAGQKVQIYAEELNDEAKETMKNASTVMAATYPVVQNGKNVSSMGPMTTIGQLSKTERAQRTAIGVKADGTYVYFVSSGRASSGYGPGPGLTISEVGDAMIELGCVSAVNLDGGGSSTINVNGTNKYVTENRAVGSVMMIVSRNGATTSVDKKQDLNNWIYNATSELNNGTYTGEQKNIVQAAIYEAQAVYNDVNSMNGEYIRQVMNLRSAMGLVEDVKPKTYISLKADDWSTDTSVMTASNLASGALVLKSLKAGWPWATFSCDVTVPAEAKIFFDIEATANASIELRVSGGNPIVINRYIAPSNLDAGSGDILANGQRFKGSIDVKTLNASGLSLSGLGICSSAGSASSVTVHDFSIRTPYSAGDVDGDFQVNSNDARALLRHFTGVNTLSGQALAAADANGDAQVSTNDIRTMLEKSVGLA